MDNEQDELSKLAEEFAHELKGQGSISPHAGGKYVGYDIHPEDVEALFFDGIGVPRWASIESEDLDEHNAIYMERYNEKMAKFPLIGRANDTFVGASYASDEVAGLLDECQTVIKTASEQKAVRATKKLLIAARKAEAANSGLELKPRI